MENLQTATLEILLVVYVGAIRELRPIEDAVSELVRRLERRLLAGETELASRAARQAVDPAPHEPAPGIA